MSTIKVFLVPGFFGFTSFGSLSYFNRVAETVGAALADRGVDADLVECPTLPTGSIRHRADRVLQTVIDHGGLDAETLHFVGHSTGGLDVRLLLTPGVRLRPGDEEEQVGRLTGSVVTVCTPHFGTPLAGTFTSLHGRPILRLLTALATSDRGRHTLFLAAQAAAMLAKLDNRLGRSDTVLDMLSRNVLSRLTPNEDDPVWRFLNDVSNDQGAIIQLTPESLNLYNAAVVDHPGVTYACLVAAAPTPSRRLMAGMGSLERTGLYALFSLLYLLASQEHQHYPYPSPATLADATLDQMLGSNVTPHSNDGIVPTLSQVYGEIIDIVVGDHLDVVGQFANAGGMPYADWLPSGAAFDEQRFQRVWDGVAGAIAGARRGEGR